MDGRSADIAIIQPPGTFPVVALNRKRSEGFKAMEVTDHNLDQIIMSLTSAKWQKVEMVLAKSLSQIEDEGVHILAKMIAARIEYLVLAGHLEAQGDLSSWRHSEIRLPERAR